jgi:hypothetical protein
MRFGESLERAPAMTSAEDIRVSARGAGNANGQAISAESQAGESTWLVMGSKAYLLNRLQPGLTLGKGPKS